MTYEGQGMAGESTEESDDEKVESPGMFPQTRWSLVVNARSDSSDSRDSAVNELYRMYWYPVYAYVRMRGQSAHNAEDLTQGFFAHMLTTEWLQKVEKRERGKMRSFLLSALQNFMISEWRKETAQKRGGGEIIYSIEAEMAEERFANEPKIEESPESLFERRWAVTLLGRVFESMKSEYLAADKLETYETLLPLLNDPGKKFDYESEARKLETSAGNLRVMAFRMRKQFRAILKDEVAETVSNADEVDEEMAHLRVILARA